MPVIGNEDVKAALSDKKRDKQRQEIARLTRLVAQLNSEKKDLLFELNKERAANSQLRSKISLYPIGKA